MFRDDLPTKLWVEALIRRVLLAGAAGYVLQKGEASRGDVLVKVANLRGDARIFVPRTGLDGVRRFVDLTAQGVDPDERSVDDYIQRVRNRDRDLWIVEIEDREGRHFLTEQIEKAPRI
jgi:hypothetical protein